MFPIAFDDLIGKVLLVGLTYYTHDECQIEKKQFYGIVESADEKSIRLRKASGEILYLPPELEALECAAPGEYRLRSTGEIVSNPDFTAFWNIYEPENHS